jgi:peptidoglycan/xylan/chitin deacetylase (PgdA/CDA1 family)
VLIFHRVLQEADPLFPDEVDIQRFDKVCTWLKAWFDVMPLDVAVTRLREGDLPARAAAITFDDGYLDNCQNAMPVLQRHGLTATFFIATDFRHGGCMWNDAVIEAIRNTALSRLDLRGLADLGKISVDGVAARREALRIVLPRIKYLQPADREVLVSALCSRAEVNPPVGLMMRPDHWRQLRQGGMSIGAHTCSHPILARIDHITARHEIFESRRVLESELDEPVTLFAYPNGKPVQDYGPEHVELVRDAGFTAAVNTAWGPAGRESDPFQIPRFTPWDRSRLQFGLRLAWNLARRS